jgi:hypothetical protein
MSAPGDPRRRLLLAKTEELARHPLPGGEAPA